MCLDRRAADLQDWASLAQEADQQSNQWRMVIMAAITSSAAASAIDEALDRMVMAVHQGKIQAFVPLDREGQAVQFS